MDKILREFDKNDIHLLGVDAKTGQMVVVRSIFEGDWVPLSFYQRVRLLFSSII